MDSNSDKPTIPFYEDRSADHIRMVAQLVSQGRVEALHTLAVALDAEADDLRTRLNRAEVALQHVAFTLAATPGEAYVDTLLKLLPNRPFLYNRLNALAAALVRGQQPEVLMRLFERYMDSNEYAQAVGEYYHVELMSLIAQEMIIRRIALQHMPSALRLQAKLRARRHPLAWLPLALNPLEDELTRYLPPDDKRSLFTLPSLDEGGAHVLGEAPKPQIFQPMLPLDLPPVDTPLPTVRETTRTAISERIRAAAAKWYNLEVRTFVLPDSTLSPYTISPRLLLSLGLESLEGAEESEVRLGAITPNRVLAGLFAVADTGGPHEGFEGAYGRLHAWGSLGALAGAAPEDSIETVCKLAQRCTWFHFQAETTWFYRVGWDIGILALRPDGASFAVFAATATD